MFRPTRRTFLADVGMGFTGLALGALLARDGVARAGDAEPGRRPTASRTFRPEGQERHLAVHGRRRQPRRELRPEAGPESICRQDDRRDAVQGDPRFAAPEKEPARVHPRPAQGPAEGLSAPGRITRNAANAEPRSATGGRTSATAPTTSPSSGHFGRRTTTTAPSSSSIPAGTPWRVRSRPSVRGSTTGWGR